MKPVVAFAFLWLTTACVTPPSTEVEIQSCQKIPDKNFRDRCIADALRKAETEHQIERMSDRARQNPE